MFNALLLACHSFSTGIYTGAVQLMNHNRPGSFAALILLLVSSCIQLYAQTPKGQAGDTAHDYAAACDTIEWKTTADEPLPVLPDLSTYSLDFVPENKLDRRKKHHGKWVLYYDADNDLLSDTSGWFYKRHWIFDHGTPIDWTVEFNRAGQKTWAVQMYHFQPDSIDGLSLFFNDEGTVVKAYTWTGDENTGPSWSWSPDSTLFSSVPIYKGMAHGIYREYYRNGRLHRVGAVSAARKNGTFYFFFEDGTLHSINPYVDDQKHGLFSYFRKTGEFYQSIEYKNGLRHGVITEISKTGDTLYAGYVNDSIYSLKDLISGTSMANLLGDRQQAIDMARIGVKVSRKIYGPLNLAENHFHFSLAGFFSMEGQTDSAAAYGQKCAIGYREEALKGRPVEHNKWLLIGTHMWSGGLTDSALAAFETALTRATEEHGQFSVERLKLLTTLAGTLSDYQNGAWSENWLSEAIQTARQLEGEMSALYWTTVLEKANWLGDQFRTEEKLVLIDSLLLLVSDTDPSSIAVAGYPGITDSLLIALHYEHAEVLSTLKRTSEAYRELSRLQLKISESQDFPVQLRLKITNELARMEMENGRYAVAEQLFISGRDAISKSLKSGHSDSLDYYAQRHRLANYYRLVGRTRLAFEEQAAYTNFYRREIARADTLAFSFLFGDLNKRLFAGGLHNLAQISSDLGLYAYADTLIDRALVLTASLDGEDSYVYANVLHSRAGIYMDQQKFDQAESAYVHAIQIMEGTPFAGSLNHATYYDDMSEMYTRQKNFPKAEDLAGLAYEMRLENVGPQHPLAMTSKSRLAYIWTKLGKDSAAYQAYSTVLKYDIEQLSRNFPVMSERERSQYLSVLRYRFSVFNAFAAHQMQLGHSDLPGDLGKQWFNFRLANSALLMRSEKHTRQMLGHHMDDDIRERYEQWMSGRRLQARLEGLTEAEQKMGGYNLDSVRAATETLEKDLRLYSNQVVAQPDDKIDHFSAVRNALQPGEAAVEIVECPGLFAQNNTETTYWALVIRPEWDEPGAVPLFSAPAFNQLIEQAYDADDRVFTERLYGLPDGSGQENVVGKQLSETMWNPLVGPLQGVHKVYFSSAGPYHRIAVHLLPGIHAGDLLKRELPEIKLVSSSSVIPAVVHKAFVREKESTEWMQTPLTAAIFGGIDYEATAANISHSLSGLTPALTAPELKGDLPASSENESRGGSWSFLNGARAEAAALDKIFNQNGWSSQLWNGAAAAEERFKALNGSNAPNVLHIATHGFFYPDPVAGDDAETGATTQKESFSASEDPLMRAGLVLAGGNHSWTGSGLPPNMEDGILTAQEISWMDLSNTDLAVLSACRTGLGTVDNDEGVYGLQRAFRMAGVDQIVLSLWQVPDRETSEFMLSFYTYMLRGETADDAFSLARNRMARKYTPYYWGAFVLLE